MENDFRPVRPMIRLQITTLLGPFCCNPFKQLTFFKAWTQQNTFFSEIKFPKISEPPYASKKPKKILKIILFHR